MGGIDEKGFKALIIPVVTLSLPYFATIARLSRASFLQKQGFKKGDVIGDVPDGSTAVRKKETQNKHHIPKQKHNSSFEKY